MAKIKIYRRKDNEIIIIPKEEENQIIWDEENREILLKHDGQYLRFSIDESVPNLNNVNAGNMGTNYYLRRKLPDTDIYNLCNLLWDGDYEKVREMLPEDIHIGKRSYGWRFLWDHNNFEYFIPTVESITEFLKSGIIVDEYGEKFTYEKFMEEEVGNSLTDGCILEKYYEEEEKNHYRSSYRYDGEEDIQKLRRILEDKNLSGYLINPDSAGEFLVGDYRFSSYTGFS